MKFTDLEDQVLHFFLRQGHKTCNELVTYKKDVRAHVRDRFLNHKYFQTN
jgi:hypothetical protein